MIATELVYHVQEQIHGFSREDPENADWTDLVTMVDTYDPARQAVVVAAFEGGGSISIKMKLDPPTLVDEADGVH